MSKHVAVAVIRLVRNGKPHLAPPPFWTGRQDTLCGLNIPHSGARWILPKRGEQTPDLLTQLEGCKRCRRIGRGRPIVGGGVVA